MLAQADLAGLGARDVATLSGGQVARVSLLRTLLSDPVALFLDEPFSRLDASFPVLDSAICLGAQPRHPGSAGHA